MPVVDIEKEKAAAKLKKDAIPEILPIEVGGKTFYRGKIISDVFDDFGECLIANQNAAQQKEFKRLGLNELGQTPEQAARIKKIQKLINEKAKILEDAAKIDAEIATIKAGTDEKEKEEPKKKRKKRK